MVFHMILLYGGGTARGPRPEPPSLSRLHFGKLSTKEADSMNCFFEDVPVPVAILPDSASFWNELEVA
jgi:hypothetical protein